MSWATRRKLIYLTGFFFIVAVVVGIPMFLFLYRAPTCFDGKKDGSEDGVDCGGSCVELCKPLEIQPVVDWQRAFEVTPGVYSALAYIENPNISAEAQTVPYTFSLYDSNNVLIATRSGSTYIPPGQNFAVFESGIALATATPARTDFEFTGAVNWQKPTANIPQLIVSNPLISNASTSPVVNADVENPGVTPINRVDLTAIVYDVSGNAVAASKTYITNLSPQSSQHIVFTWPNPFPQTAYSCATPTDVMLDIDRSGSMAADGSNPPEPMTTVKNSAIAFVNLLSNTDQAGVISFANTASSPIDQELTTTMPSVIQALQAVTIHTDGTQNTNIEDALEKSVDELNSSRHNPSAKQAIVLLTDGVADYPEQAGNTHYAEQMALNEATIAKGEGIDIYTIGLGSDVNSSFLQTIATAPDHYFTATTSQDIASVYGKVASSICKKGPVRVEIIPEMPSL